MVQVKVDVTEAQVKVIACARKKSGRKSYDFRRFALKLVCEYYGEEWVDDTPQHGGNRRSTKSSNETLDK